MNTPADSPTDALGQWHPPHPTPRIVSLVPSLTELIIDLGLGDNLVGRTRYCIHPAEQVSHIPSVGGTKKIRLDQVRDLNPTHVLVNIDENPKAMADALRACVPHLVVTHPQSPCDNLDLYRLLGAIFDRSKQAQALCERFEHAHQALLDAARAWPPCSVLYLIWRNPWMTISHDTYVSRTLAAAGMISVGHDPDIRYPEVVIDEALLESIDAVFFSSEPFPFKQADLDAFAEAFPSARHKVAMIDGEMVSWYGSRAIAAMDYLRTFRGQRQHG